MWVLETDWTPQPEMVITYFTEIFHCCCLDNKVYYWQVSRGAHLNEMMLNALQHNEMPRGVLQFNEMMSLEVFQFNEMMPLEVFQQNEIMPLKVLHIMR